MTERPCNDCPFLRRSKPRGVGSEFLHYFLHTQEGEVACEESESICVGSLIYMSNTCKLPREPEYSALVAATPQNKLLVFASLQQMQAHHERRQDDGLPQGEN